MDVEDADLYVLLFSLLCIVLFLVIFYYFPLFIYF